MHIAFVSECVSFSGILSRALTTKYPSLQFEQFESPQLLIDTGLKRFKVVLFKLTNSEKFDSQVSALRKQDSNTLIIGLTLGKAIVTLKGRMSQFDFIFQDNEIENKLIAYFDQNYDEENKQYNKENLQIDDIKRKYINLDINRSRCLILVAQNKTSKEISVEMNKSIRTIEKHIVYLRKYFNVNRKKDLINICRLIRE